MINENCSSLRGLKYFIERSYYKTIRNETKEQKGDFLSMLLGTLGASLLGNLLTGKGTVRAGEGTMRAGEGIEKKALMPPHPLTNFEIREYYEILSEFLKKRKIVDNLHN